MNLGFFFIRLCESRWLYKTSNDQRQQWIQWDFSIAETTSKVDLCFFLNHFSLALSDSPNFCDATVNSTSSLEWRGIPIHLSVCVSLSLPEGSEGLPEGCGDQQEAVEDSWGVFGILVQRARLMGLRTEWSAYQQGRFERLKGFESQLEGTDVLLKGSVGQPVGW